MKILKIEYSNIGLFKEGFSIDFTAVDRVLDSRQVDNFYKNFYTQKVISFIGANATGKTTGLKLINMAMNIVLNNASLDKNLIPRASIKNGSKMIVDFFLGDYFYRLESTVGQKRTKDSIDLEDYKFVFLNEVIYIKPKSSVRNKAMIFDYDEENILLTRGEVLNHKYSTLKDQDSIVSAVTKNNQVISMDMIYHTNMNYYGAKGKAPIACINLFDNSIESIEVEEENEKLKVCFKDGLQQSQCEADVFTGENILSSGTMKGGNFFVRFGHILKSGGYLIIDELENHLHKKLVQIIIGFFLDPEINKNGATLIFSTHYSETIDFIGRKDNIYVFVRANNHVAKAIRYSEEVKRNDIKKSEVYLSNTIKGTAPSYENIMKVREYLCKL